MASGHEWKRPTAANHASPRRSRRKKLIAVTVSLHLLVPFISSSELVVSQHLQGEGGNLAIKFRLKLSFYLWMHPTWKPACSLLPCDSVRLHKPHCVVPAEHLSETCGETQGVSRGVGSHRVSVVIDECTESNCSALGDFFCWPETVNKGWSSPGVKRKDVVHPNINSSSSSSNFLGYTAIAQCWKTNAFPLQN